MDRFLKFLRRYIRARRMGVAFRGTRYTRFPPAFHFGGRMREIRIPDHPFMVSDFIDIVLDDDYGLRHIDDAPRAIVDIGANVGHFCNYARDRFPEAVIHAYEPSPENAAYARANAAHALTTIFEEGVAGVDGRAELIDHRLSNIVQTRASVDGAIALVGFATVLERAGGHIDLLKVDCEGAEWDFMNRPDLFAHVGHIRMEYHLVDGRTLDDLKAMAQSIGFDITHLRENQGFGIAWLERAAAL
jgi:FkbM family methyltransferase